MLSSLRHDYLSLLKAKFNARGDTMNIVRGLFLHLFPVHREPHVQTHRLPPRPVSEEKTPTVTGGGGGEKLVAKLRAKEEAHAALVKTNSETFRLSNDGRFPAKVYLAFEKQPQVSR